MYKLKIFLQGKSLKLIEILQTIPNDDLLPCSFLIKYLSKGEKPSFNEFLKFIPDPNVASIWRSLIGYWKHNYKFKNDALVQLSALYSPIFITPAIREISQQNEFIDQEKEKENQEIEKINEYEKAIKVLNKQKEGSVQITTRRRYIQSQQFQQEKLSVNLKKSRLKIPTNSDEKNQSLQIWENFYLVLTLDEIEFYKSKEKIEKIGSLKLKDISVFQKNVLESKLITNTEKDSKFPQEKRAQSLPSTPLRSKKIVSNEKSIQDEQLDFNKIFLIRDSYTGKTIQIKVSFETEKDIWVSEILKRKRALNNNYISIIKQLCYKDPDNIILHNLLVDNRMILASAIIENDSTRIYEKGFETGTSLAQALVYSFYSKNKAHQLIRALIHQEITVEKTTDISLFRSSTFPSKALGVYSHMVGEAYLKETISSLITSVSQIKTYLEVDSDRVGKEAAERNKNAIITISSEFISKIIGSLNQIPVPFFEIASWIDKTIKRIYPLATFRAINSFIFLRFFVPAIATPEAFGIIEKEKVDITTRKNLVLISKIIQNIANQTEITVGNLVCLNSFIAQTSVYVTRLYHELIQIPNRKNIWIQEFKPLSNSQIQESLAYIRSYISRNFEDIRDVLLHYDTTKTLTPFVFDFIENLIEK
ncbi:ras gtpase-activating protein [Anaeramoeba ignava]|uniref:Ras gtpase-activating protein n=1 Tax=Anaeramoeba ignava TaxID=1746090 RepID=A0A9Q0LFT2_ANAIG|nr:ras gtpase-activating protein [Anaeramoeba ignava]